MTLGNLTISKSPFSYLIWDLHKIKWSIYQIIANSLIFPALAPTNSWETHRAGLQLPGNVCGCRLPRSCGSRCHRIDMLLAKDFGSPRAQKSSAPPSPTLLPFTCAAVERKTGEEGVPLALAGLYVHTHPHEEAASAASGDCGNSDGGWVGGGVSERISTPDTLANWAARAVLPPLSTALNVKPISTLVYMVKSFSSFFFY